MTVKGSTTVKEFKQNVFNLITADQEASKNIDSIDQVRLRNPKNDDLGDIIAVNGSTSESLLSTLFLHDGKEFLVQKLNPDEQVSQIDINSQDPSYTFLVRQWNPQTWEFGTLYELTIDKTLTCNKLAEFIQANLYPDIDINHLFATRVNILSDVKPFVRSDLALKSWRGLQHQKSWVG